MTQATTEIQFGNFWLLANAPYEVYEGDCLTRLFRAHLSAHKDVHEAVVYCDQYRRPDRLPPRMTNRVRDCGRAIDLTIRNVAHEPSITRALRYAFPMPVLIRESWHVPGAKFMLYRVNRIEFTLAIQTDEPGPFSVSRTFIDGRPVIIIKDDIKPPTACTVCGHTPPPALLSCSCKSSSVRYCGRECQKVGVRGCVCVLLQEFATAVASVRCCAMERFQDCTTAFTRDG